MDTRESYQNYKFLAKQCSSFKRNAEIKNSKTKRFDHTSKHIFISDCLEEERMKSFNTTFQQMETNQFHSIGPINTHRLKSCDFQTEKYGCSFVISKCLSDWNLL